MIALGKVPFQLDLIAADSNAKNLARPDGSDPVQLGYYYTPLCTGCHGADLGGAPPLGSGAPPGANLTPAGNLRNWTLDEFRNVFATGRTPEGKTLKPAFMPWNAIGKARPDEVDAIRASLKTVPAVERTVH